MVAPLLPGAEGLAGLLRGKVDHALIDRYNYHYADRFYKKYGMQWALEEEFFQQKSEELQAAFEKADILSQIIH